MQISNSSPIVKSKTNQNEFPGFKNNPIDHNAKTAKDISNAKTIDMKNISLNEVNHLIRAGFTELLDVVPNIPGLATINLNGSGYSKNQEDYSDIKIDFIAQIEGYIEFEKSIGRRDQSLDNFLEKIKKLDGMKMPETIDVKA